MAIDLVEDVIGLKSGNETKPQDFLQGTNVREEIFKSYGFTGSNDSMAITAEKKMLTTPFVDPLYLNFRWLIDWDKPYGLFADESNINSALAYLKRIGEDTRYTLLQQFIKKFKEFIRDYEFMVTSIEGLDEIVGKKPFEVFTEDDKLTLQITETSDMRCQGLLSLYRQIWFDDVRGVEVLPANLRRFDCYVLVYNAGYYSMLLYDITGDESYENASVQQLMFPTIKKLNMLEATFKSDVNFNHTMFCLQDASFVPEDTMKTFFSEIQNTMDADTVKNNIVLTYRFANITGKYYNISGNYNIGDVLALLAAEAAAKQSGSGKLSWSGLVSNMKESIAAAGADAWNSVRARGKNLARQAVVGTLGNTTPLGNALNAFLNPGQLVSMVAGAVTAGIEVFTNKYIFDNITKVHNMVSGNFSDTMLTDYVVDGLNKVVNNLNKAKNEPIPKDTAKAIPNIGTLPEPPKRDYRSPHYMPDRIGKVMPGIQYGTGNVYTRETF